MSKSLKLSPKISFTTRSFLYIKGHPDQGFEEAFFLLRDDSGLSKEDLLKEIENNTGLSLSSGYHSILFRRAFFFLSLSSFLLNIYLIFR